VRVQIRTIVSVISLLWLAKEIYEAQKDDGFSLGIVAVNEVRK
jgi:hypothetical protein